MGAFRIATVNSSLIAILPIEALDTTLEGIGQGFAKRTFSGESTYWPAHLLPDQSFGLTRDEVDDMLDDFAA